MATKKKNELRLPTQDERENAMNEIAIMFCENKRLSYGEIRSKFDFVISDILLEFELSGLIVQLPGQQFVLVETVETVETVEEVVVEVEETIEAAAAKNKRRSKYDVFNQRWSKLFADKHWILQNRHEFVLDYLVLMTSRKTHRTSCNDYYVTKTKKGYTIGWKNYKSLGLNNLDPSTAYSWAVRNGLRSLAVEADQIRVELCKNL